MCILYKRRHESNASGPPFECYGSFPSILFCWLILNHHAGDLQVLDKGFYLLQLIECAMRNMATSATEAHLFWPRIFALCTRRCEGEQRGAETCVAALEGCVVLLGDGFLHLNHGAWPSGLRTGALWILMGCKYVFIEMFMHSGPKKWCPSSL